jgi:nucleoside-diphosphate-sugar epimerase
MNCLVTGAAGFIGSHLCERLLELGHEVTGIDAFIPYYPRSFKERNLSGFRAHPRFRFHERDLASGCLNDVVGGTDVIFHLAATPGLVKSWTDFDGYLRTNVTATQRLLDAVRSSSNRLTRLIYVSTSSVYGKFASGDETLPTKPISPYGVTKLAGENLCRAFGDSFDIPVVILRYFSVYGPRQRPDMGYHLFIRSLRTEEPVTIYGDGQQVRGNTYVSDCVDATVAAVGATPGEIYNVGGGEMVSVWDVLHRLENIAGRKFIVQQRAARAGDQRHTFADTSKLRRQLGWQPTVGLDEGLVRQWEWQSGL